jgi:4,5-DOPA dioxygenase extradiol
MLRKDFIKTLVLLPIAINAMKLDSLNKLTGPLKSTAKMPVLFLGHGSPMNAIELNEFSRTWQDIGNALPRPAAVLCVSAHWETWGTFVTAMEKPATIHDFGGFPQALFDVQYPAPGDPELAAETKDMISDTLIQTDQNWGLDHGCWSVMKHLYPDAGVPVIQLSLDYGKSPKEHYNLARQLTALRKKGILIIGSGNIVHNLRMINWHKPDEGFDWAQEANSRLKKLILADDAAQLVNYKFLGREVELSVPTPEHFLPLIYTLGLREKDEEIAVLNDKLVMGSIAMTSVRIG